MTPFVELTLKMSLLLGLALIGSSLFSRRSAALSHLMLAAGVLGATILPLAQVAAPSWSLPVLPVMVSAPSNAGLSEVERSNASAAEAVVALPGTAPSPSPPGEPWRTGPGPLVIWAVGSILVALPLVAGLLRMSALRRTAAPVASPRILAAAAIVGREHGIVRPIALLHGAIPILATWGWRRPVVFLPADAGEWSDSRLRIVLAHELAHVRRRDSPLQTIAGLLRAALWFNPLAWIVARRLRDESERACDDLVLEAGIDPADYADELLALARCQPPSPSWMSAPAMARSCSLERRVAAMFDEKLNRRSPSLSFRMTVALAVIALTTVIGGYRAMAQGFATFSGQVQDTQGGYLAGVTLTLSNRVSGQKYEVKSNAAGGYEFVGVSPGDYEMQASRPGFNTYRSTRAIVAGTTKEQLVLQVGTLEETISVRGGGPRDVSTRVNGTGADRMASVPAKPAAPAPPCVVSAEGGQLRQPTKIKDVRPIYPPALEAAKTGELLEFDATIGIDGAVREVKPAQLAINPELAAAATAAILQWRFTPTLLNCAPVEVEMRVHVRFSAE